LKPLKLGCPALKSGAGGLTPLEKLKRLIPWIHSAVVLFPVISLEKMYGFMPSYPTTKVGTMSKHITTKIDTPDIFTAPL